MKYVSSLFLLSGYFVQLCMDVGITVYYFHKMSLGTMHYVVFSGVLLKMEVGICKRAWRRA